ncbi:MAG: hypothetical protein ACOH2B_12155 [Burkholderiaceae bacterium]
MTEIKAPAVGESTVTPAIPATPATAAGKPKKPNSQRKTASKA